MKIDNDPNSYPNADDLRRWRRYANSFAYEAAINQDPVRKQFLRRYQQRYEKLLDQHTGWSQLQLQKSRR